MWQVAQQLIDRHAERVLYVRVLRVNKSDFLFWLYIRVAIISLHYMINIMYTLHANASGNGILVMHILSIGNSLKSMKVILITIIMTPTMYKIPESIHKINMTFLNPLKYIYY